MIQFLILAALLLFIPTLIGGLFIRVDKGSGNLLFRWVSGQFLLWAGFQLICVPLILRERSFESLVKLFSGYTAALALLGLGALIQRRVKGKKQKTFFNDKIFKKKKNGNALLWILFWGLLLFQLVQAVRLAYADSDDAYYVAVSAITQESGAMYRTLPYTGGTTQLDIRHGLAPFPVWISFLAQLSGMRPVMLAQSALPPVLISITYAIYYLMGSLPFPEKEEGQEKLPLFLVFAELLVLFGNYSIYTAENFLLARSRQGKAALGNIVIPFLFLLLLIFMRRLQEARKVPVLLYLLMGAAAVTGCLCSTLGALLVSLLVGTAGVLAAVCYRRPLVLFPLAVSCAPCVYYALLYLTYH